MAEATFNSKDLEDLAQNMYRTAEKLYPREVKRFLQKEGNWDLSHNKKTNG